MMSEKLNIELLYFDGCPNAESARELLDKTISELGIIADVISIEVKDNESAISNRFLGSPSIRVNGKDIEFDEGPDTQYSMRCRIYGTNNGKSGLPSKELLREALRSHSG